MGASSRRANASPGYFVKLHQSKAVELTETYEDLHPAPDKKRTPSPGRPCAAGEGAGDEGTSRISWGTGAVPTSSS